MRHTGKAALVLLLLVLAFSTAAADICLIVFPLEESVYHYKATRYYTVGPGHVFYEEEFDRGGEVLIESATDQIALEIYRANVVGFEAAWGDHYGYEINESPYTLVVQALSDEQAVYPNILLAFLPLPDDCDPAMTVDGVPVVGKRHPLGDLVVDTPDQNGGYFGEIVVEMTFAGCEGVDIWAFSDENGDQHQDSEECTSSFLYHLFVPTEESSFSTVKSLFR